MRSESIPARSPVCHFRRFVISSGGNSSPSHLARINTCQSWNKVSTIFVDCKQNLGVPTSLIQLPSIKVNSNSFSHSRGSTYGLTDGRSDLNRRRTDMRKCLKRRQSLFHQRCFDSLNSVLCRKLILYAKSCTFVCENFICTSSVRLSVL
jgi:hypothetical protein